MVALSSDLHLTPCITPHGRLILIASDDAVSLEPVLCARIKHAFDRGAGHGLLRLGAGEIGQALPPVFAYWREFASQYITILCTLSDVALLDPPANVGSWVLSAPLMPGAEYITPDMLRALWRELGHALIAEFSAANTTVQKFLEHFNPAWHVVGRVHFNLAENRKDEKTPFAFLATYTDRLSSQGKAQHRPLGQALREYAGADNKDQLLSLLLPVQRAAGYCAWLKYMVDAGEVFHPLRWTAADAFRFLGDIPELERAGVVVRLPVSWKLGRPSRAKVTATVGASAPSLLRTDALLDFKMEMTLDGEKLTDAEIKEILASTQGLALIRGQWVEVDPERLSRMMERFQEAESLAHGGGLSFAEAMRMIAGADLMNDAANNAADPEWSGVVAGPWLADILKGLRSPEGLSHVDPGAALHGTLRPYQHAGVQWLHLLAKLGLGACLADDMGLGKTIQILALLLVLERKKPSLLVAPASLLSNWASEIEKFAPSLKFMIAHGSLGSNASLTELSDVDLVITSYGSLLRLPWLVSTPWHIVIIDEAQAIKNPGAKQTREVKKLKAHARIALTGTPVENRMGDLWSIFDFINPGLLGSAKAFTEYTKRIANNPHNPYGPLRSLVRPYILRRLKNDKSVISDLPDKTEMKAYCQLSHKQAVLYQQAVKELTKQLDEVEGIKRKGLVVA